jgi:hypothetical protein
MNRDRRSGLEDPAARRPAAQPTSTSTSDPSGVYFVTGNDTADERDDMGRGAFRTRRRYDQPIEDDDNPVMPTDDATLNTKI